MLGYFGTVWYGMLSRVGNHGNKANLQSFGLGPSVWQHHKKSSSFLQEHGSEGCGQGMGCKAK